MLKKIALINGLGYWTPELAKSNKIFDFPNNSRKFVNRIEWSELKDKKIMNKNILISFQRDMENIKLIPNSPIFIGTEKVFMYCNGRHFTYDWLKSAIFPSNPKIYLNSPPYDISIFNRGFNIHLVDQSNIFYQRYKKNLHFITNDQFKKYINEYILEELQISKKE